MDSFSPPPAVAGMSVLDEKAFEKTITVPGIVLDKRKTTQCTKTFKNHLIGSNSIERVPNVQKIGEDEEKRVRTGGTQFLPGGGAIVSHAHSLMSHTTFPSY